MTVLQSVEMESLLLLKNVIMTKLGATLYQMDAQTPVKRNMDLIVIIHPYQEVLLHALQHVETT